MSARSKQGDSPKAGGKRIQISLREEDRAALQRFTIRLAESQNRPRVTMAEALHVLIEIGLGTLGAGSKEDSIGAALHRIDPNWSGKRLRDIEPIEVTTQRSPVDMALARSGGFAPMGRGNGDPNLLRNPAIGLPGTVSVETTGRDPVCLEDLPEASLFPACRRIGELWNLPSDRIARLLGTSRSTWARWIKAAKVGDAPHWNPDHRARALALLRIFEAVGDLHQKDEDALAWPHQPLPGPAFNGRRPLEVMESGIEEIFRIRDYLNFILTGQA